MDSRTIDLVLVANDTPDDIRALLNGCWPDVHLAFATGEDGIACRRGGAAAER